MDNYKAPIRDLQFNIFELFGYDRHYQDLPGYGDVNAEIINAILNEFDKFCSNILSPLNAVGDQEGCQWHDGEVTTPGAFGRLINSMWRVVGLPWRTIRPTVGRGSRNPYP